MEHTPGPWKVMHKTLDGNRLVGDGAYGFITIMKICDGKNNRGDMEHNARLIAAAPDLLEACKEALNYVELFVTASGAKPEQEPMFNQLQQAIAKAKGA